MGPAYGVGRIGDEQVKRRPVALCNRADQLDRKRPAERADDNAAKDNRRNGRRAERDDLQRQYGDGADDQQEDFSDNDGL